MVRPPANDLVNLTIIYLLNILLIPFAAFISLLIYPDSDAGGWDNVLWTWIWFFQTSWHAMIWVFPALTLLMYTAFGSSFFLFRFLDDLGLYFVTKATSKWSYRTHVLNAFLFLWAATRWNDGFSLVMFFVYSISAWLLESKAWNFGVNAARRMDPTWNEHRGMLYPPVFYSRGWTEDEPYDEPSIGAMS